jgi:hypothetical protein
MPYTLGNANAYNPISLNRILLSYTYMTQGLLRTVVDQPVEDAFKGGITYKSDQLSPEELTQLNRRVKRKQARKMKRRTSLQAVNTSSGYNQSNSDIEAVKQTTKWGRLYGGSGLIINTDQPFGRELDVEKITEESPLAFIAADRWELLLSSMQVYDDRYPTPYNYYGLALHRSRVERFIWAEAPSYIRQRLQGWGMSILEECIRPVSTFIKYETLLFELLDQAKIDVFKIEGFNTSLASDAAIQRIQQRVQMGNQLKNYSNAITMDMKDDYQQKQLTFSGLADIWDQLRTNLCAYLKFPKNKLFGESAGGLGSGKDSAENYNCVVENVRDQANPLVQTIGELRCQQMFGYVPDDLEHEWKPLEVLDGEAQERIKASQQTRTMEQFDRGLLTGQETAQVLRKQELMHIESEVEKGLRDVEPPLSENPEEAAQKQEGAESLVKAKADATPKPKPAAAK